MHYFPSKAHFFIRYLSCRNPLYLTVSEIKPRQDLSSQPAHPDAMGENNNDKAFKDCGKKIGRWLFLPVEVNV